jgi:hypothetical protein
MYPLFFVLVPAFALQSGVRFLFRRKTKSNNVMKKKAPPVRGEVRLVRLSVRDTT